MGKIVVTGMGALSAAGKELRGFWETLYSGTTVYGPVKAFADDRIAEQNRRATPMTLGIYFWKPDARTNSVPVMERPRCTRSIPCLRRSAMRDIRRDWPGGEQP